MGQGAGGFPQKGSRQRPLVHAVGHLAGQDHVSGLPDDLGEFGILQGLDEEFHVENYYLCPGGLEISHKLGVEGAGEGPVEAQFLLALVVHGHYDYVGVGRLLPPPAEAKVIAGKLKPVEDSKEGQKGGEPHGSQGDQNERDPGFDRHTSPKWSFISFPRRVGKELPPEGSSRGRGGHVPSWHRSFELSGKLCKSRFWVEALPRR